MIVMDSIAQLTLDIIAKVVESGITIANAASYSVSLDALLNVM